MFYLQSCLCDYSCISVSMFRKDSFSFFQSCLSVTTAVSFGLPAVPKRQLQCPSTVSHVCVTTAAVSLGHVPKRLLQCLLGISLIRVTTAAESVHIPKRQLQCLLTVSLVSVCDNGCIFPCEFQKDSSVRA